MSLLDAITGTRTPDVAGVDEVEARLTWDSVAEQLQQAADTIALLETDLREASMSDVELSLEDRQWQLLGATTETQFTRQGLLTAARLCRIMAIVNPLIRRAVSLRTAYVWGGGVEINARATGNAEDNEAEQDVNTVIQGFLDDKATSKVLTSATARERVERTLGTDGTLATALFTSPLTGRVQPRSIPTDEITDVISNPEDVSEVWFYKRVYTPRGVDGARMGPRTVYYPDLDFRPRGPRPVRVGGGLVGGERVDGAEILWDAPVAFLTVNGLDGWQYGIGDAFAAIPWARAHQEFLQDWAKLVKSLSRFAWRLTSPTKTKATQAAAAVRTAVAPSTTTVGEPVPVGAVAASTVGSQLEAIPKSGATIDSESGKPLAAMVASAMDVPVTMLLADPGQTGARAVAETLDRPTELMAGMRRAVHQDYLTRILGYVVDAAVRATRGPLTGSVTRDEWGREVITLDGDTDRTIVFDWPDLTETPIDVLVKAVAEADGTGKMPPLETLKLLLGAFGIRDIEEILEAVTDENGQWIDQDLTAGQAAVDRFRRGDDDAAGEALT